MNKDTIFNKIAIILEDLHDQHFSLAKSFNTIDLDLFSANAHYLADYVDILKKITEADAMKKALEPDFLQSLENKVVDTESYKSKTNEHDVSQTPTYQPIVELNEKVKNEPLAQKEEIIIPKITPLYDEEDISLAFKRAEQDAIAALNAPEVKNVEDQKFVIAEPKVEKMDNSYSFRLVEQPEEERRANAPEVLPDINTASTIEEIAVLEVKNEIEIAPVLEEIEAIEIPTISAEVTPKFDLPKEIEVISNEIQMEESEKIKENTAASQLFTATDAIVSERQSDKESVKTPLDVNTKYSNSETATLNEKIGKQSEYQTLISQLAKKKITELKSGIGLNEKFLFIQALFNGDANAYNDSIELLNGFSTYSQADQYIRQNLVEKFNWTNKKESVSSFYDILRRRFI